MDRKERVFTQVEELYESSSLVMSKWMWNNHVQWVANKAKILAEKYKADIDKVYCAALLHDVADTQYERGDENFNAWSESKGREILTQAGLNEEDVKEIIEIIIRPHSCRPGNLPTTLEGKVFSTADAMFHLQTNFFPMFCYKKRPERTKTYEEWQSWFEEKIDRDFVIKIFFDDERAEVKDDYNALYRVFRNKTLNSQE